MDENIFERGDYRTPEIFCLMEELKRRLIKTGAEQGGEFIIVTQQFLDEHISEEDWDD